MSPTTSQPEIAPLRDALDVARAVRTRDDLTAALEAITAAIAAALRCRTVAVNLHRPACDDFEVATVHGSERARRVLLGQASSWEQWAPYLAPRFGRRGAHHVPAGSVTTEPGGLVVHRPDGAPSTAAESWDPDDLLLAVMRRGNGDVLGIVSVDEPLDGLRPTDEDCERLVTLAAMAGLAAERALDAERDAHHRGALERLLELSRRPRVQRTRGDVMDAVCAGVREALGFGRAAVLLAENGGLLRPAAAAGWTLRDPVFGQLALTLAQIEPLLGLVPVQQGCHLVEREEAETMLGLDAASIYRSPANGHGPYAWQRHWLLAPLRDTAGALRGVLWVDDPADGLKPGRERLQLLRLFADQAAAVLEPGPTGPDGAPLAGSPADADHDPLTGLARRGRLVERLRHALQRVKRAEGTVAVLFLDLDNFQHANDTLGHAAGDELLRATAARIDEDLRPGDTVARFGGDEFVVLCEDIGSAQDAMDVAERLRALLSEPIPLNSGVTQVTVSIGVALPDRPDRGAEGLLQAADRAMYEAKAAGRDAARLATPGAGWP